MTMLKAVLWGVWLSILVTIALGAKLNANELESRYLTDDELLELNDMDDYLDELEAQYPTDNKQITVCWSESQQRLVPVYMGCH